MTEQPNKEQEQVTDCGQIQDDVRLLSKKVDSLAAKLEDDRTKSKKERAKQNNVIRKLIEDVSKQTTEAVRRAKVRSGLNRIY